MKTATITLEFPTYYGDDLPRAKGYGVVQVTDSVSYRPGQVLTKDEVAGLCEMASWKVIIRKASSK